TAYLSKDAKSGTVYVSEKPIGEKIITEYRVMGERDGLSEVEVTLHTGKTHQIRAHMAFIGHPVRGDTKYGDKAANERYHFTRQCLMAKRLQFSLDGEFAYLNEFSFVSKFTLPDLQ
ncbi:MAG: RNA pseudouridine synthase, partial [Clostridia bacterium]|nr:RNA pseudouridine synthase [Clostridia bacterium]